MGHTLNPKVYGLLAQQAIVNSCIPLSEKDLRIEVCKSANGYYLGVLYEGMPLSRESYEYWPSYEQANEALRSQNWTQNTL